MYFSPPSWQNCKCSNFILPELLGLLDWPQRQQPYQHNQQKHSLYCLSFNPTILFIFSSKHPWLRFYTDSPCSWFKIFRNYYVYKRNNLTVLLPVLHDNHTVHCFKKLRKSPLLIVCDCGSKQFITKFSVKKFPKRGGKFFILSRSCAYIFTNFFMNRHPGVVSL
jgi:hypothetical protein